MKTNWEIFFRQTSERQYFFTLSKEGFRFNKGHHKGVLIKDLYRLNKWGLREHLEDLYNDSRTTGHTKLVIKEIMLEFYNTEKINK